MLGQSTATSDESALNNASVSSPLSLTKYTGGGVLLVNPLTRKVVSILNIYPSNTENYEYIGFIYDNNLSNICSNKRQSISNNMATQTCQNMQTIHRNNVDSYIKIFINYVDQIVKNNSDKLYILLSKSFVGAINDRINTLSSHEPSIPLSSPAIITPSLPSSHPAPAPAIPVVTP